MICKFCGFNNVEDAAFCIRCGSPLRENHQAPPAAESVIDEDKKTIRMENRPNETASGGAMMHDCGYPLLPGVQVCPKCHRPVAGAPAPPTSDEKKTLVISNPAQQSQGAGPKATEQFVAPSQGDYNPKKTVRLDVPGDNAAAGSVTQNPNQGASAKRTERYVTPSYQSDGVNKKTVNIHQVQQAAPRETEPVYIPYCSLKPLAREGETTGVPAKHEYENSKVILNRQNTDPGNFSITSQQQALLVFEDGKWYIEDKSAYKTTYIKVTKKTELQNGDIVVLGDREFEFSTK